MKKFVVAAAVLAAAISAGPASALPHSSAQGLSHRDSCGIVGEGSARCFAKVVTQNGNTFNARPSATGGIAGYSSTDLQDAYKLTGLVPAAPAPTVAIVDAYDDPNAEGDLATYRSAMGLGPCDSLSGCFTKINQSGGLTPPSADKGWAEEISLDLDMVSSACPACHILLVEASSNSFANLGAAEDQAASRAGVVAISNSYGGSEFSSETTSTYDGHFNHPPIAITVSSGDSGYGPEYPAASQYVTAAGGTSLKRATNARGWSETAWSGAGSGCSSYEPKPSWQKSTTPSACGRRTIADVSSVADPNTGVAVNDTYGGDPGWMVFGGTSAAAPFIAAVYALDGSYMGGSSYPAALPYGNSSWLFDVTSGSNGRCTSRKSTSTAYLCTATTGYDGPTGLGTPNGKNAF